MANGVKNLDVVVNPLENRQLWGPTSERKGILKFWDVFSNLAHSEHVAKCGWLAFSDRHVNSLVNDRDSGWLLTRKLSRFVGQPSLNFGSM